MCEKIDQEINALLQKKFLAEERVRVIELLSTIRPEHVMAGSEYNLKNTRLAILKLAKTSVDEVKNLIECAKVDFRDVIYWATMESEKK